MKTHFLQEEIGESASRAADVAEFAVDAMMESQEISNDETAILVDIMESVVGAHHDNESDHYSRVSETWRLPRVFYFARKSFRVKALLQRSFASNSLLFQLRQR